MNLAAYDKVDEVNYLKTWIDPRYKRLYSRELPFYKFYSFAKRYNNDTKETDFYLILHNNLESDITIHSVISDKGMIKMYLKDIWNESIFKTFKTVSNVTLTLIDKQDDCVIYLIDI